MSDTKKFELSPSISIIVAGVLIAGAIIFVNLRAGPALAEANPSGDLPANAAVPPPSASDHIIGDPNAPVVLIEYLDFQCYYCMQVHPTLKRIVDESKGQIAWVMRNLPLDSLHPEARPAALAAECIAEQKGNDGWWAFADDMFSSQDNMGTPRYLALAQKAGVNMAQYLSCTSTKKYNDKLDAQSGEAYAAGGQGTPFTIVYGNGASVPVSEALPYAQFSSVIKAVQARQQ